MMNGTGVMKVYLIQSKKYAYHLKFVHVIAPEWVLEALKNVSAEDSIGFEDEANLEVKQVREMNTEVENQEITTGVHDDNIDMLEDEEETRIMGGQDSLLKVSGKKWI
jgi:hypothetical protein